MITAYTCTVSHIAFWDNVSSCQTDRTILITDVYKRQEQTILGLILEDEDIEDVKVD